MKAHICFCDEEKRRLNTHNRSPPRMRSKIYNVGQIAAISYNRRLVINAEINKVFNGAISELIALKETQKGHCLRAKEGDEIDHNYKLY